MKKFQILLGLTVLVLALYTVASPVSADAKSLIGSWVLGGGCCYDYDDEPCQNGPMGTQRYCHPTYWTFVCLRSDYTGMFCDPLDYDDCDLGGYACPGEETGCS